MIYLVSTLFWMKIQLYFFRIRLYHSYFAWIKEMWPEYSCNYARVTLQVMYRVPTYVHLKEILWIYDGIFFFRFEFKLLWNSDFMLLSYSEIIIIEIFPFNLKKKKNLATSSFNYVAIYFSIYSLHYFETVCSKDP